MVETIQWESQLYENVFVVLSLLTHKWLMKVDNFPYSFCSSVLSFFILIHTVKNYTHTVLPLRIKLKLLVCLILSFAE